MFSIPLVQDPGQDKSPILESTDPRQWSTEERSPISCHEYHLVCGTNLPSLNIEYFVENSIDSYASTPSQEGN